MKRKLLILGLCIVFMLTGCGKNNNLEVMTVYSSVYPIEYVLDNLYGSNLAIYSIYPDGVNYKTYEVTDKLLTDYSKGDLYVYNGSNQKERDYAVSMINKNKKIKIIDASLGMNYLNDTAEVWLNPANYLMMASNIKKGLEEYVATDYIAKQIDSNYEKLKLKLSQIDADLKNVVNNATDEPTIVVSNDVFKYLEKYGFNIISLQEGENLTDKTISEVKKLISNGTIKYIFLKDNEEASETIESLKKSYPNLSTLNLNTLSVLSVEDRKDKKDYISIMEENINLIKLEVNK